MKKLSLLVVTTLAFFIAFAQQNIRIIPASFQVETRKPSHTSIGSFENSSVRLGDRYAVINTYGTKDYGVSLLDNAGRVIWSTRVEQIPQYIKKFGDKLFIRATSGTYKTEEWYIVNEQTGAIEHTFNGWKAIAGELTSDECNIIPVASAKDVQFIIQYYGEDPMDTRGLELITISTEGAILKRDKIPLVNFGVILDIKSNTVGDIFVLSLEADFMLKVQQFDAGTLVPSSSVVLENDGIPHQKSGFKYTMNVFPHSDNVVVQLEYTNDQNRMVRSFFSCDLERENAKSYSLVVDGAYYKEIQRAYKKEKWHLVKPQFQMKQYLGLSDCIPYNDKLIIYQEISYTSSTQGGATTGYATADGLITLLDHNMEVEKQVWIPKRHVSTSSIGLSSQIKLHNGKLYVISAHGGLFGKKVQPVVAEFNLTTNQVYPRLSPKEDLGVKGDFDPKATLWDNENLLLSFVEYSKNGLKSNFSVVPIRH